MGKGCLFEAEGFAVRCAGDDGREDVARLSLAGSCAVPGFLLNIDRITRAILDLPQHRLVVDAGGVENANSRFLGLLIILGDSDKEIRLVNPSRFLRDMLEVVGLLEYFTSVEGEDGR